MHDTLLDIVTLSLESDPKLVPHCAKRRVSTITRETSDDQENTITPKPTQGFVKGPIKSIAEDEEGQSNSAIADDREAQIPSNPSAISVEDDDPTSSDHPTPTSSSEGDPDDFVIMEENQAKRIVGLCKYAFGVDLSADVVVADANVGALTQRILGAKSLAGGGEGIGTASKGDGDVGNGEGMK